MGTNASYLAPRRWDGHRHDGLHRSGDGCGPGGNRQGREKAERMGVVFFRRSGQGRVGARGELAGAEWMTER